MKKFFGIYNKLVKIYIFFFQYFTEKEYLKYIEEFLILYCLFFKKKIDFKFLSQGQSSSNTVGDMEAVITKQILRFKETNVRKTFFLLEIGSYLGNSIEVLGNILQDHNIDFHILSVDPYLPWNSKEDIKERKIYETRNKQIEKIHLYFLHNLSLLEFREKIIHIRKPSKQALNFLKEINLSFDFIFIDGSHLYENFKTDYTLCKDLLFKKNNYIGLLSGDDFEIEFNEFDKIGKDKNGFEKLLVESKNRDYIISDTGVGFHPGITLFFSEISDKIIKFKSGFWHKE